MSPLSTMRSIPRTLPSPPTVTIYGPEMCPNCDKAKAMLDAKGIEYTKIDIEHGDDDYRYVTETLGYRQAPAIVVEHEGKTLAHWGGHRMDMLMALVRLCTTGIVAQAADDQAGAA